MGWLAAAALLVLHSLVSCCLHLLALYRHLFTPSPQPLEAKRRQLPAQLAIVFAIPPAAVTESVKDAIVQSTCQIVGWCARAGVQGVSVYDRHGIVIGCSEDIRSKLLVQKTDTSSEQACSMSDFDIEFPLTPPPSEPSTSRSLSPDYGSASHTPTVKMDVWKRKQRRELPQRRSLVRRRRAPVPDDAIPDNLEWPVSLSLLSYDASKPCMASAARKLAVSRITAGKSLRAEIGAGQSLHVADVDEVIREIMQIPPPSLMIVHSCSPCQKDRIDSDLQGFPPWLINLTEIHFSAASKMTNLKRIHDQPIAVLSEEEFRRALDNYSAAEMRLGK